MLEIIGNHKQSLQRFRLTGSPSQPSSSLLLSKMAILDSSAVFVARIRQFGLESLLPAIQNNGWGTWGDFAFSTTWIPGTPDDSAFYSEVVHVLIGEAPQPPMLNAPAELPAYNAQKVTQTAVHRSVYTLHSRFTASGNSQRRRRKATQAGKGGALRQIGDNQKRACCPRHGQRA